MDFSAQRAVDFLREEGIYSGDLDMGQECRTFLQEMEKGLSGKESSLAMLPSYLATPETIPSDVPVVAIDAGGTNFRAALVTFNRDRKLVIENFRSYTMPGTAGEIGGREFFLTMAEYVRDLVKMSSRIGFCFSYPVRMEPGGDGRLITLAKEMRVTGIQGDLVGRHLLTALKSLGVIEEKKLILLNDTVAVLLAGCTLEASFSGRLGLILGTGTNISCIQERAEKPMIINIESGAYGKAPRGALDIDFDSGLKDPGLFTFEKMISGKYLGPLLLALVKKAGQSGLFSLGLARKIAGLNKLETEEINQFLSGTSQVDSEILQNASPGDRLLLSMLAENLVTRAGFFTAMALSALVIKTGQGQDPNLPVLITAEGTTFYRLQGLQETVKREMTSYLTEKQGLHFQFAQVENAVLTGSALAALSGDW